MICKNELRCTMKDRYCKECKRNLNAELRDYFHDRGYIPTCPHGWGDCIHDPARRLFEYDSGCSWKRETYTRAELEERVKIGCDCNDEYCYDDEDK